MTRYNIYIYIYICMYVYLYIMYIYIYQYTTKQFRRGPGVNNNTLYKNIKFDRVFSFCEFMTKDLRFRA